MERGPGGIEEWHGCLTCVMRLKRCCSSQLLMGKSCVHKQRILQRGKGWFSKLSIRMVILLKLQTYQPLSAPYPYYRYEPVVNQGINIVTSHLIPEFELMTLSQSLALISPALISHIDIETNCNPCNPRSLLAVVPSPWGHIGRNFVLAGWYMGVDTLLFRALGLAVVCKNIYFWKVNIGGAY